MANKIPEEETQPFRQISFIELENALEELTQEVVEKKQQVTATFQHLYKILAEREKTLLQELDAIPAEYVVKLSEGGEQLEQLSQLKKDTKRELEADRMNESLKHQLSEIQIQINRILTEQIRLPKISFSCSTASIRMTLEKKCHILKTLEQHTRNIQPIWHGVAKGKGNTELSAPTALCIHPNSQLIYVGDYGPTCRIQVFTSEGKYHSTILNEYIHYIHAMKIQGQHLYVATTNYDGFNKHYFIVKLSGEITIRKLNTETLVYGLCIECDEIYTCSANSLTVHVYDLNLQPTNEIELQAVSFEANTHPSDIIVNNKIILILFRYFGKPNHADQVQVFQLDGVLICSLISGEHIRHARYFCMDSDDNILVCNRFGHCVRIFSPEGVLIHSIGSKGKEEPGEMWQPGGIAVDSQGRLITVDRKDNNKLQVFKYT